MKFKCTKGRNTQIITSASLLISMTLSSTLISCSKQVESQTSVEPMLTTTQTETTETSNPYFTETPTSTTNVTENYDFIWDNDKASAFDDYCMKKFNLKLSYYVIGFGFTDDLNSALTDFINERYNTNYTSIPFSKVNYFFGQINKLPEHYKYREYDWFCVLYLRNDSNEKSAFRNKLVLSYLIANNIPVGSTIPIENFKNIAGDNIYNKQYLDEIDTIHCENLKLGNYDFGYRYNDKELFAAILCYNRNLSFGFNDERIKTRNFADSPETIEVYNKNLKKFYGENAPQIGEVLTKEQYFAMFGEEPLDLSYIPGAIMNDSL